MGRFYHTHRTRTIGPKVRVTLSTGVMHGGMSAAVSGMTI
jgi:hypothetical protein